MRQTIFLSIICVLSGLNIVPALSQTKGSGLPLPRHVSLRGEEVNMRTGPGILYPVDWVYRRKFLPIEVIAEYGTWRKVRDWQGTQGWVHQSMLSRRRTFIIMNRTRTMRSEPNTKSTAVARLEPGVIGTLRVCPSDSIWCKVQVNGLEGWLRRVEFWGVYRYEALK